MLELLNNLGLVLLSFQSILYQIDSFLWRMIKSSATFKLYLKTSETVAASGYYFRKKAPEPKAYIKLIAEKFSKEFINALYSYSYDERFSVAYVQDLFNVSLQDAKNIYTVIKEQA